MTLHVRPGSGSGQGAIPLWSLEYQDELTYLPFSGLPGVALRGRLFYTFPHDTRRRIFRLSAPRRYNALQRLRHRESAGYSLAPYDEHRCIFVHVPKTAGVSASRGLFGGLGGGHAPIGLYQIVYAAREFHDYFKFTFVRNPWDRLLSAYEFLRDGGMDETDRRWAEQRVQQFDNFDDFVRRWVNEENVLSYVHFVPQYRFLCAPFSHRILMDWIGRFEQLENDFDLVRRRLGLTGAHLHHHNEGPRARERRDFREHYTPAARRIVERVYRIDIELLGYSFDGKSERRVGSIRG
jgi:Sulfotransferase family